MGGLAKYFVPPDAHAHEGAQLKCASIGSFEFIQIDKLCEIFL